MHFFTESPYLLVQDDLIVAKVRALNVVGWSEYSKLNTIGQVVQTKPLVAPPILVIDAD
jgi:hypothetical protein